jgi:hypothetical protein
MRIVPAVYAESRTPESGLPPMAGPRARAIIGTMATVTTTKQRDDGQKEAPQ